MLQVSYFNHADAATLSGGSWVPTLPLTNMQQNRLSRPARSIDTALASTTFDVDLGAIRYVVRMFGMMNYNCTQDALVRITGGETPGATTVDTGWVKLWRPVYGLWDRDFEHPEWFSGAITAAEAAAYPGVKTMTDLGTNFTYRYWRFEFSDVANPSGYIELARLWMGPVWSPKINYDWGALTAFTPRDRGNVSRSGERFIERMRPARMFRLQLHELSDQEAIGRVLDMMRLLGSEGQIVVIPNPDAVTYRLRQDIYGRVSNWGEGLNNAAYEKNVASITVEDLL